jgi:hypothetical protein
LPDDHGHSHDDGHGHRHDPSPSGHGHDHGERMAPESPDAMPFLPEQPRRSEASRCDCPCHRSHAFVPERSDCPLESGHVHRRAAPCRYEARHGGPVASYYEGPAFVGHADSEPCHTYAPSGSRWHCHYEGR